MDESMKATGNKIICMDKGTIDGLTAENMRGSTMMTGRMGTECTPTLMAAATKECGRTASNTVKASSSAPRACHGKASGRQESACSGTTRIMIQWQIRTICLESSKFEPVFGLSIIY